MSYQDKASMPPPAYAPEPARVVYMAAPQAQVGPDPTTMTCPHCNSTITSRMETEPSKKTHLFFLLLCIIGCICCAPFVYCTDSCLAKKHTCPKCNHFLGVYDS